ncbi:MAG: entericidin [Alphaproteobacteria bacterium]|nr:entericidin [Alphaproteobacteria bacterium]MBV9862894.1 entericidin [Alphaproteobacteria bacterium]
MKIRDFRGLSLVLAVFAVLGASGMLSACSAVQGAGQDISAAGGAVGGAVSSGAAQTQRATGAP